MEEPALIMWITHNCQMSDEKKDGAGLAGRAQLRGEGFFLKSPPVSDSVASPAPGPSPAEQVYLQMEETLRQLDKERKEKRDRLSAIIDSCKEMTIQIQERDVSVKQLKRIKSKLRVLFAEIEVQLEARIVEVDEAEDAMTD